MDDVNQENKDKFKKLEVDYPISLTRVEFAAQMERGQAANGIYEDYIQAYNREKDDFFKIQGGHVFIPETEEGLIVSAASAYLKSLENDPVQFDEEKLRLIGSPYEGIRIMALSRLDGDLVYSLTDEDEIYRLFQKKTSAQSARIDGLFGLLGRVSKNDLVDDIRELSFLKLKNFGIKMIRNRNGIFDFEGRLNILIDLMQTSAGTEVNELVKAAKLADLVEISYYISGDDESARGVNENIWKGQIDNFLETAGVYAKFNLIGSVLLMGNSENYLGKNYKAFTEMFFENLKKIVEKQNTEIADLIQGLSEEQIKVISAVVGGLNDRRYSRLFETMKLK